MSYADARMVMAMTGRSGIVGRVRATPAPSCCGCAPPIPSSRWPGPPATPRPARAVADLYPSLAAAYPRPAPSAAYDPAAADGLDLVFLRPAPRRQSSALVPDLRKRVGRGGRPGRRLPAEGPGALPARGTARSTRRPSCSAEFAYGLPELFRDELVGADRGRRRPAATRRRPRWPSPRWCGPALIEPTAIVVDAASGVSGAGRALKPPPPSARSTRTSPPTGCSTTATRRRSSRRIGATGAVHAPPGADEPGDPGHLLRPARPAATSTDGAARRARATPTPTSRSSS